MSITFEGEDVVSGNIHLPMNGAWTADLYVSTDKTFSAESPGAVSIYTSEYSGFIDKCESFGNILKVSLVGGSLDLTENFEAIHKKDTTIDDELADIGIILDTSSGVSLPFWSYPIGTRGASIQMLADALAVSWRFNPDGTLRMRSEDFPSIDQSNMNLQELNRDAARQKVIVSLDSADITPGITLNSDQVGEVDYLIQNGKLRCAYSTDGLSSTRKGMDLLIKDSMRNNLFYGTYLCQVLKQNGDGTLDLLPDNPSIRGNGIQYIPIKHGLPGVTVTVEPGAIIQLSWSEGNPSKPYASLWDNGGSATKIKINLDSIELGGTIKVALATLVKAEMDRIASVFDAHTHAVATTGTAAAQTGTAAPTLTSISPIAQIASEKLSTK